MCRIGPVRPACVPALLESLVSGSANVRGWAIHGIRKVPGGVQEAAAVLGAALGDRERSISVPAAFALGEMGLLSPPVVVALEQLSSSDEDERVRQHARDLLGRPR